MKTVKKSEEFHFFQFETVMVGIKWSHGGKNEK